MRGLGAMAMVCLATGCLYLGEVNYPPEVSLVPEVDGPYYRGTTITLRAVTADRNASGDSPIALTWTLTDDTGRVLRADEAEDCTAWGQDRGCFVPLARDLVYRMTVTASDERGATATAYRDFTVENRGPTAKLTVSGRLTPSQHHLIHQQITLSGLESTDPDDEDLCRLTYAYEVVTKPLGAAGLDLADCLTTPVPQGCSATAPTACYSIRYRPDLPGTYQFRLTVTDPAGATDTDEVSFEVEPDAPPCLAQLVPAPIPLIYASRSDGTKRFSVNVEDDLDDWPPTESNAAGFPTFTWSLQTAGDPDPVPIPDYTSNQYALDLLAFSAGEEILVRVDLADRVDRSQTSPCALDEPTCPANADPLAGACVQRVTWLLKVY